MKYSLLKQAIIKEELLSDIITKYLNVGTKQFLKKFRESYKVKKTAAHRQMVLMKKEKKETKAAKVSLQHAYDDKSRGKCITHQKLQAFLTKYGKTVLCSVYTRAELMILGNAYGIKFNSRMKKAQIGESLADKISVVRCIPNPYLLIDNSYLRVEPSSVASSDGQGIRSIRIVWAPNA